MAHFTPHIQRSWRIDLEAIKANRRLMRDKTYFWPSGCQIFFGEQGMGKTLTAVLTLLRVKQRYPLAMVCSNLILTTKKPLRWKTSQDLMDICEHSDKWSQNDWYFYFGDREQFQQVCEFVNNGTLGVIIMVDEIQQFFSNMDSKAVPEWLLPMVSEMRKQRKVFIMTAQDYDQVILTIRRRYDTATECKTYTLPFVGTILTTTRTWPSKHIVFTDNLRVDYDKSGDSKKRFYWHSQAVRDSFDSYQRIFTGSDDSSRYVAIEASKRMGVIVEEKKRIGLLRKKPK